MNRQREITDILNKWAHEYYVLDAPTVSDKEYDTLYDELRALEKESGVVYPDSPTRRVGGDPIKGFEKHTHIARLFSLDKSVSETELSAFLTRVEKFVGGETDYTVEYKFDGLTVCLTYDKGQFVRATTRGNGVVGEDVTAQVLTIKSFPLTISYQGTLEVRGEAVIRLSVLDKYNETAAEPLKNARNAAAGAIRNLDPKITEKRRPDIYFYDVNYRSEGQEWLEELRETLAENIDYGYSYIKEHFPDIEIAKPEGTYLLFLDCTKWCEKHNKSLDELIQAGRIDGASQPRIFLQIVLPMAGSTIATLVIFTFLQSWNDYLLPLVLLSDSEKYTLPVALGLLANEDGMKWELNMAAATFSTLPILTVFYLCQEKFISSLAMSGMKG